MTSPVRPVDCGDDFIRCHIVVPVSPGLAFERFRHDIVRWWPRAFTWSGECLEDLVFEGRKGGCLWERGPEGLRFDMARVQRWIAPERVILRWHIGPGGVPEPNPARASEVEIRFLPADGGTRTELEHRGFFHHGSGGVEYRNQMAERWPRILESFATCLAPKGLTAPGRLNAEELSRDPVLKDLPALV